jgi:hypothetical protein
MLYWVLNIFHRFGGRDRKPSGRLNNTLLAGQAFLPNNHKSVDVQIAWSLLFSENTESPVLNLDILVQVV